MLNRCRFGPSPNSLFQDRLSPPSQAYNSTLQPFFNAVLTHPRNPSSLNCPTLPSPVARTMVALGGTTSTSAIAWCNLSCNSSSTPCSRYLTLVADPPGVLLGEPELIAPPEPVRGGVESRLTLGPSEFSDVVAPLELLCLACPRVSIVLVMPEPVEFLLLLLMLVGRPLSPLVPLLPLAVLTGSGFLSAPSLISGTRA